MASSALLALEHLHTGSRSATTITMHPKGYEHAKTVNKDSNYSMWTSVFYTMALPSLAKEDFVKLYERMTTYTVPIGIVVRDKSEVKALIRVKGNEVISEDITEAEVVDLNLKKRVEEWARAALSLEIELPEDAARSWDWMDGEYVKRKLGLPP